MSNKDQTIKVLGFQTKSRTPKKRPSIFTLNHLLAVVPYIASHPPSNLSKIKVFIKEIKAQPINTENPIRINYHKGESTIRYVSAN